QDGPSAKPACHARTRAPRPSRPNLPWRLAGYPELFQHCLVAQGVHRLPETAMLERHHLPHGCQADDGRAFKAAVVAVDKIENARRQNEKAAVDHAAVAGRFLGERYHLIPVTFERAVAAGWPHRRDRSQLAVTTVVLDGRANIDITDAVAIGEAKRLLIFYIRGDAL